MFKVKIGEEKISDTCSRSVEEITFNGEPIKVTNAAIYLTVANPPRLVLETFDVEFDGIFPDENVTKTKKVLNVAPTYNIKRMIKDGVDRNMIVYDSDAKPGVLTPRLLNLMRTISVQNDSGDVYSFLVAKGVFPSEDFDKEVYKKLEDMIHEVDDDLVKYFDKEGGSLPTCGPKRYVVIGLCENREVLLGAY